MKIYLGGKMSGKSRGDNWRNGIVDSLPHYGMYGGEYGGGYGVDLTAGCGAGDPPETWPTLPKSIFGKHDYVGPYLVGCDHGCFHTGDHATSINWAPMSEEDAEDFDDAGAALQTKKSRQQITKLCMDAMTKADMLFFWIDSLDAYGTMAELVFYTTLIGMANTVSRIDKGEEIEKHFFVASPSFDALDEMWFAFQLVAGDVTFITTPTPEEALSTALALVEESSSYSPIEKKFISEWKTLYGNGIVPQYNVPGFRYRVDFAFPDDKVAVELDGYEYHNSKEQFTNDRKRQREMELAGWRFIRFSGSEIYNNAGACVRQAYEFWQSLKNGDASNGR